MTGSCALPLRPNALDGLRPACREGANPVGKSAVLEPDGPGVGGRVRFGMRAGVHSPEPDATEIAAKLPRGG
jgi:hypothetical protein